MPVHHHRASSRGSADPICISGVGLCSPLGGARQTFAAVRAGLSRKRECPSLYACLPEAQEIDEREPLIASAAYHLDTRSRDEGRVAEWLGLLAARALLDLSPALDGAAADSSLGFFMSLPSPRPGWSAADEKQFTYCFHNQAARDLFGLERFALAGHCGALALCEEACALLQRGELRFALVGGAESYLFADCLEPLDQARRIRSSRSLDGFTPGEGAAMLLLEPVQQARARGVEPLATLMGAASARCEDPSGRAGAGAALAEVLSRLGAKEAQNPIFVCDLNGERARMREWAFALSRLSWLKTPFGLEHPANMLGDMGAASGSLLAALAVSYLEKKYPQAPAALVFTAGDDGERRALLLGRGPGSR